MPILVIQCDGRGVDRSGQQIQVPPSSVLSHHGPRVQAVIGIANSFAEQMNQQGIPLPNPLSGIGLIDTGASTTCIDDALAQQMGLPVIDVVQMTSASHDSVPSSVYPIQIQIVGSPIRVEVPRAMGANLAPQGLALLIGRDFLQHCTLHYNGVAGSITLAI